MSQIATWPPVIVNATVDSVKIGNSVNGPFLLINPDGSINTDGTAVVTGTVDTNLLGLNVFQTSQYSVGLTAVQLTPTPLTNRSSMSIKVICTGIALVYIGNSAAVTTGTGYFLSNGDSIQLDLTPSQAIWAIASAAGQVVFVAELAK